MRDGAAAPVVAQTIIAPACPQEAWFQLLTLKSKTANSIEPHGLPMMMDAVLELFWPELGHNFSAGLNLQLRPNCQMEIVQIDLGIYICGRCSGCTAAPRGLNGGQSQLHHPLGVSLQRRWRIADEDAIHRLVGCKGASGIKPCLMCCNVFLKGEVRDSGI